MSFGRLLREVRKQAGKSMGEVARHLGVSTVYVSDVENEHRAPFTKERIFAVAELFSLSDEEIERLLAVAAESRGVFELGTKGASKKAMEVGAALMRGWPELSDDALEQIEQIVSKDQRKE